MKYILIKIGIIVFGILYFVLPDPIPGPLDDIVILILSFIAEHFAKNKTGSK